MRLNTPKAQGSPQRKSHPAPSVSSGKVVVEEPRLRRIAVGSCHKCEFRYFYSPSAVHWDMGSKRRMTVVAVIYCLFCAWLSTNCFPIYCLLMDTMNSVVLTLFYGYKKMEPQLLQVT